MESISYNDAIKEIEKILLEVESEDVGVDNLSKKVERVSFLIETCKTKLLKTEEQVERIFNNKL